MLVKEYFLKYKTNNIENVREKNKRKCKRGKREVRGALSVSDQIFGRYKADGS